MKQLTSTIALTFSLLSSTAALADHPGHGTVRITGVSYAGTGCPVGSVQTDVSEDGMAMTMMFSEFKAEVNANTTPSGGRPGNGGGMFGRNREDIKNCQLRLRVAVPKGFAPAVQAVETRGFVNLENKGMWATISSQIGISSRPGFIPGGYRGTDREEFIGPLARDFMFAASIRNHSGFFGQSCSKQGEVEIIIFEKIGVKVQNHTVKGSGLLTVDTVDGLLKQTLRLDYRKC